MPDFHTQTTNEIPKVLIVGEQSLLAKLAADYYQQHQIKVFSSDFEDPHFLNRCREIVDENELYKIVLICGLEKDYFQEIQKLTSVLNPLSVSQVYILRMSTKIDSTSRLAEKWGKAGRREDELLQFLSQLPTNKRLIVGQDVFSQSGKLIPPIEFMLQANGNGVWFDPKQSLRLQTSEVFFNSFKNELLKPGNKNFLIRGQKIKTGEFLEKLRLLYQSFYNIDKSILKIQTSSGKGVEKKENWVEVVVDADLDRIEEALCRDLPNLNLSLNPHYLSKVKKELAEGGRIARVQPKKVGYTRGETEFAGSGEVPKESVSSKQVFSERSAEKDGGLSERLRKKTNEGTASESKKGLIQQVDKEDRFEDDKRLQGLQKEAQELTLTGRETNEKDETFQELRKIYGERNERQKTFYKNQARPKTPAPLEGTGSVGGDGEGGMGGDEGSQVQSKSGSRNKSEDAASKKEQKSKKMDEEISRLFSQERTTQKTRRRQSVAGVLASIRRKSKRKQALFWLGTSFAALGMLFAISLGGLVLNYRRSQATIAANLSLLQQGDYEQLKSLPLLKKQADLMGKILDISIVSRSHDISQLNLELISLAENISESEQAGQQIFTLVVQPSGIEDISDFNINSEGDSKDQNEVSDDSNRTSMESRERQKILEELIARKTKIDQRLYQKASLLEAEIDERELAYFEPSLQKELEQSLKTIQSIKKRSSSNLLLDPKLPGLLGLEGEKTYFLVIQDNQELRPTGGFIQALAMIVLRDGLIADQRVFNVNNIDNKAMGRLSAPAEITTLLGEEELYLRDANWNPDFKETAKTISWFISEALNQPTDGIIGVNYNLVENLLKKTGEITVENYEEGVVSSNLYDRLRYHANEEKEQFLEENFQISLWKTLLKELRQLPAEKQRGVINTLLSSFNNHQSTVYISDPEINQVMTKLGWTGEIIQPECPSEFSENCLIDQIYQVEANIGINKVNTHITRQLAHHIEIEPTQVSHKRQLEVSNKTQSQIWPMGTYKAYFRFYLNPEATLDSLKLDGEPVPQGEIIEYIDHNRKVLGVVVDVPPGSSQQLTLLYSIPKALESGDSYFFFNQAQPGFENHSAVISLSYPSNLSAALVAPQVEYEQNQLVTTNDKGHAFLVVKFE